MAIPDPRRVIATVVEGFEVSDAGRAKLWVRIALPKIGQEADTDRGCEAAS